MSAAILKELRYRGIYGWLDGMSQRQRWGVYGGGHLSPEQKAWVAENRGTLFRAMVGARITAPPESEERVYVAWLASRATTPPEPPAEPPPAPYPTPTPPPPAKEPTVSQSALLAPPDALVVSLDAFRRVVGLASRAAAPRGPLPILAHLRLTPSPDGLHVQATDTELEVAATCGAKSAMEGAFTLPAKQLGEILSKLPSGDVELTRGASDAEIVLRCQRSKFTLRSLAAAEFPRMEVEATATISLPAGTLAEALLGTLYACADEVKGIISGALLDLQGGELKVVATDGYRMALAKHTVEEQRKASAVVPHRGAQEVLRASAAAAPDDAVRIELGAKAATFHFRGHVITTRLLNGQFPGYQALIPAAFVRTATMHRASLQAAVERALIMSSEADAHLVRLAFVNAFTDGQGAELIVEATASEKGEAVDRMEVQLEGPEDDTKDPSKWLIIYFNGHFLVEAMKALQGEVLTLRCNGHLSPVVACTEEDGLLALLMPVNRS